MYDLQNRMTKTFRGKKSKDFADKLQLLSQHILNIHDSSCLLFLVSVTNGMDSRNKKQKFCLLEENFLNIRYRPPLPLCSQPGHT